MTRPILLRVEAADGQVERAVAEAISAGFDGIDLLLGSAPFQLDTNASGRVLAVSYGCESASIEQEAACIAGILHEAGAIGARVLNVTIPALNPAGFARYQDALNCSYELIHRLRLEAEASGVALAIEAPAAGSLRSPVELREIIDAANSWAVGACIDCARITASGGSPADWIETLSYRVHAVRASSQPLENSLGPIPSERPLITWSSASDRDADLPNGPRGGTLRDR